MNKIEALCRLSASERQIGIVCLERSVQGDDLSDLFWVGSLRWPAQAGNGGICGLFSQNPEILKATLNGSCVRYRFQGVFDSETWCLTIFSRLRCHRLMRQQKVMLE